MRGLVDGRSGFLHPTSRWIASRGTSTVEIAASICLRAPRSGKALSIIRRFSLPGFLLPIPELLFAGTSSTASRTVSIQAFSRSMLYCLDPESGPVQAVAVIRRSAAVIRVRCRRCGLSIRVSLHGLGESLGDGKRVVLEIEYWLIRAFSGVGEGNFRVYSFQKSGK